MKTLTLEQSVDEHLKPVKDSDGTSTSLEVSTDKIRVKDLEVTGTTTGIDTGTSITVDSSLTDGSTNPVENNAVFDGLATKLNLSGGTLSGNLDLGDNQLLGVTRITWDDGIQIRGMIDADDMSGATSTKVSSSESIKAYIDNEISSVPTTAYSTTLIKVMPNEFLHNDDRGVRSVEDDTSNTLGIRSGHTTQEQYAFVRIPNGFKATHCQVLASASTSNAVTCKTFNYTTGATTDLETFDLNTNENITDVTASTTNDLVIKLTLASTSTIVYGAKVTIASA